MVDMRKDLITIESKNGQRLSKKSFHVSISERSWMRHRISLHNETHGLRRHYGFSVYLYNHFFQNLHSLRLLADYT